jgi:internalin A
MKACALHLLRFRQRPLLRSFLSYAWGGQSGAMADEVDTSFRAKGVKIVRDKRELRYGGYIRAFMERLGEGKAVILIISDAYLRSPNCLFELLEVSKHDNLEKRIFPIVLDDAAIYEPVEQLRYVKYWEDRIRELDEEMRKVSPRTLRASVNR